MASFLLNIHETWSFAAKSKSSSLVAMRRRALAKSTRPVTTKRGKGTKVQPNELKEQHLTKSFILEVLEEASLRQQTAIEALDREAERNNRAKLEIEDDRPACGPEVDMVNTTINMETAEMQARKAARSDNLSRVEIRRRELQEIDLRLENLRFTMEGQRNKNELDQESLERVKEQIVECGHGSIFRQPRSSWKITKAQQNQFGRPQGFDGDIFYSPLGVPILVGRTNAHKDEIMRNAAQGSDLWFQVEDYNGSRVLLRTSLLRGTTGSKQCRQMAANLAAKYSIWGEEYDSIPVMYTDSRKVAKRGSKIGSMKKSKSLGRIMGYPCDVQKQS